MSIFQNRPFGIWLVLLILTIGGISGLSNLAKSLNGGPDYTIGMSIIGILASVVSLWLCTEIWANGPKISMLALVVFFLMTLPYILMLLSIVGYGATDALIPIMLLLASMAAIYGGISYYLRRYAEDSGKT